jgi:hypothetical protein
MKWEFDTLFKKGEKADSVELKNAEDVVDQVIEYFALVEQIKVLELEIKTIQAGNKPGDVVSAEKELRELRDKQIALVTTAEKIIEQQIKDTFVQQGIFHPLHKYIKSDISFPPVNFKLEKPPHLLIVSPRDRIESIRELPVLPDVDIETMESIEAQVDELGVSSLVVELGGFGGTYPTLVTDRASLQFTVTTAAEEWLHQYLAFKPLGFRYLLDLAGISRNYEIAIMNETLAGIVSREISNSISDRYYPQLENGSRQPQKAESGFDFDREMREIRRTVDKYLAQGEIEPAEEFMEQKRQFLAEKGYHIRKLNQAYFAFYGTYADKPTSISPIGLEMRELRSQSASLKDFLETMAGMTSRQDLAISVR